MVMDDWVHAVGYASAGYIVPVDQWMESDTAFYDGADFVKSYADTLRYKDGYYGLPVYGESTFLMYRKDLFEQYGIAVPKTFDELTAAAKTIKEKTEGKVAGITPAELRGSRILLHGRHSSGVTAASGLTTTENLQLLRHRR